jgi:hypothetical protein
MLLYRSDFQEEIPPFLKMQVQAHVRLICKRLETSGAVHQRPRFHPYVREAPAMHFPGWEHGISTLLPESRSGS